MTKKRVLTKRTLDNPRYLLMGLYLLLIVYIPFHVFLSQWLGMLIGGLNFWKVAKDIFVILLLLTTTLAVIAKNKQKEWLKFKNLIILIVVYGVLHIVIFLLNKNTPKDVAMLATVYNNRFFWLFLSGINLGILMDKQKVKTDILIKIILTVSTLVCLLGLIQWILPKDILGYFGYSIDLGVKPNFFINENPSYPRVFSTLRDPNSLGAYLIVPSLLIIQLLIKAKKKLMLAGLLALHLLILFLSFSRASWGGLIIALACLMALNHKTKAKSMLKKYWVILSCILVITGVLTASISQTSTFRSIILKVNDTNNPREMDSDELHVDFVKKGMIDIIKNPIGDGPGTAGIVSIQNKNGGRLTENYYLQIALEVGVIGLILFVSIWAIVAKRLFQQPQNELTTMLFCVALAYSVMALVMHLWTNEVVAYTWWGLAGLVIGGGVIRTKKYHV